MNTFTLGQLELSKGEFVYLDLLSNAIFMGSNEDGLQAPPTWIRKRSGTWMAAWYFAQNHG